jgi:hypothetical protein
MYNKTDKRGVLNDYDLAYLTTQYRPTGTECTGTGPFMALDFLTDSAWDGKVERLYRHECESFAWVLLWVCCRYEDGKQINNPPLSELTEGNHNDCFEKKHAILSRLRHIHPTSSYEKYWGAAIELLKWPLKHRMDQDRWLIVHRFQQDAAMEPPETDTTSSYAQYWKATVELLTWPIIHWVQQDADISPPEPDIAPTEPDMNEIIHIYRNALKKKGFIVNLGRSS